MRAINLLFRWERGEELLEDMRAALNGSAWLKLGQGEEVLPASLLGTHDLLAWLAFVYNTKVQVLTRRKTL